MPPAASEKGGATGGGGGGGGGNKGPPSLFRNDARMKALYDAFRQGDRPKMEELISERSENARLHRKLHGKDCQWTELKEDVVYKVTTADEVVVVKMFDKDEFPFHEVCGNVVGTALIATAGPFFVRSLDVGQTTDTKHWLLVMEFLEADAEVIDLDEPVNVYNLFYQTAHALAHLHKEAALQHFDLRYDNIMVKEVPPRDLFKNGIQTTFIVKIGDWGQCEFDFGSGDDRPWNDAIPREEEYTKKWGNYPRDYTGYDFQYFLGTLTPVLDSLHGLDYYYVYTMALNFLKPCTFTTAQERPVEVTAQLPTDVLRFLKNDVAPTLT